MPVCRATKLSNSSQISSGCCTGKRWKGSHKAELIRKAQAVRIPATLRDFHLVCPGQGQVADQLTSRRKDHGQVSIIMSV